MNRWPTIKIVVEQRGVGATAWAVLVNDEVWASGLTERQAHGQRRLLEIHASPEARAAARERITGG